MLLGSALFVAAITLIVAFVLQSGGGGDSDGPPSSKFKAIHKFDTADYHSLAFSPNDDGEVLFGHHGGVQMTQDDGDNWSVVIDEPGRDAMNLVYDPFSPDTIYMAGHDVYYRSDDAGKTWIEVDSNLPGLDLHTFAASASTEGRLYAVPVGHGLYASDHGGTNWSLLTPDAPLGSNSIVELADGTLLLGATDRGILRSEDNAKTWTQSRPGIELGAIYTLKGDPVGERLYAGNDHGVYLSTDGGRTWSKTALDDTWVIAIGVDPSDPLTVLAINRNGELYCSRDGGESW